MKHIIPLLALLLLILAGCDSATQAQTSTAPTKASQPTATPTPAGPKHHTVGEAVKIYFAWEITIQKVEVKAENKEDYITELPAEKGDTFLILSLQAKNISSIEQQFDTKSFTMKDARGVSAFTMNLSAPVRPDPSGRVAQNEIAAGDITFEVPVNQRKFTLTYEMAMANANTPGQSLFIWDITIP